VPSGKITMRSRVDGRALVAEGTQESSAGQPVEVKEAFTLSPDGKTLTIAVSAGRPGETTTSTLVYGRSPGVEPCQKWPTPCK
jgi:hypothetical protein